MAILRAAPAAVWALAALCVPAAAIQVREASVAGSLSGRGAGRDAPPDAGDASPCAGCELTVDLKCDGIRSARSAAFHRIQDCLLPLYGLIEVARNASLVGNTRVCAVTWMVKWQGLNLMPFLQNLSGVQWHSIIDEREECSKQLEYHTVNRTARQMATADYIAGLGSDTKMLRAYPIDVGRNLPLLQADVERFTHDQRTEQIVMISRKGGTRMFRPVAVQELTSSLFHRTELPVVEYLGSESSLDTVKLFSSAAGVVGYHGAAWVNVYFSVLTVCNMQVSTFSDLESMQPWRINREMMIHPRGAWYFYYLPLGMLLDANHVHHDDFVAREEKDHFIKDLEWIPLRSVDVADLTDHMGSCLSDPAAYKEANKMPEARIATRRWDLGVGEAPAPANDQLLASSRDECSGCDVTVDLRCQDLEQGRTWYFSRVARCLLPAYEMVQVAREAASNSSTRVCAITWKQEYSLTPFLESLVDIRWHKILLEDDACVGGLAYHAVNRTVEQGASQGWVDNFSQRPDSRLVQAYPIDLKHNLVWMQKDAVNIAGKPSPHILILQNFESTRLIPRASVKLLRHTLEEYLHMDVSVYRGEDTVTEMLKRFTNLGIAVGYWSELWVNTLFTYTPHCAFQFSTYEDLSKTRAWRTSAEIQRLNPSGEWRFEHIPLGKILEGNNKSEADFLAAPDKDIFLKNLPWASIPDSNIEEIASRAYLCWQNKQRGYTWATESWGWHGHA